ncbi:MAG: CobD/CbiB family protein [Burkholderiaceae bacterium]|jgi:adenosylcobinamide-phosphate synthase|nr:CobD/CbiB family protein [Burkholderiaceae bacterium]
MGFVALIFTLLLEQLRPLPARSALGEAAEALADGAERNLNAGHPRHGLYAWLAVVLGCTLVAAAIYAIAWHVSVFLALAVNVVALYLTLGFRQFSHPITEIQLALDAGDVDGARRTLTHWRRNEDPAFDAADMPVDEIVRITMERGVLLSHRHVFGVFFWFVLLPGPTGPVFYRAAEYVSRRWSRPLASGAAIDQFGVFARRAFAWIDWLPVRLTALGFAVVGDFEGAIYCWRQAARARAGVADGMPAPDARTLLLAAASGALGARVMPAADAARVFDEPGHEGAGLAEPEPRRLHSGIGLVWRALILWLVLLLLLSLAGWLT